MQTKTPILFRRISAFPLVATATALAIASFSNAARAQYTAPFENLQTYMLPSRMLDLNMAGLRANANRRSHAISSRKTGKNGAHPATSVVTTYSVSPAVSQKVKQQCITWAKAAAPDDAAKMSQALQSLNIETVWGKEASDNRLKAGDLADSMAGYYLLNWALANGSDADAAQSHGVRSQFLAAMGKTAAARHLSNAQRQELSETLMVNYLFQIVAYRTALKTKNAELKTHLQLAAVQRFQHDMGADPRKLNVDSTGFVLKQ